MMMAVMMVAMSRMSLMMAAVDEDGDGNDDDDDDDDGDGESVTGRVCLSLGPSTLAGLTYFIVAGVAALGVANFDLPSVRLS